MSIKRLFDKNKQAVTVGKYLKKSAPDTLGDGVESQAHLTELVDKQKYFLPSLDYASPESFVKFGSAEQYYKNAFTYIANYYPYDGSGLEKTQFYNDVTPVEKFLLEGEYPRSTGFVSIGTTYGTITSNPSGYYSATDEYIQAKGGPHKNTFYDESKNRTSNLEFGGASGTTVEFFYKKAAPIDVTAESARQVVFDLWNGEASGSAGYGRLRIEVATGSADHFEVTMLSGTQGFSNLTVPTSTSISLNDGTWRNFGFVFNTSTATPTLDFFVNGVCSQTGITGSGAIGLVTGSMIGNLGALRTAPSGAAGILEGDGKLSGSLDEFRFWKTARSQEDIGRYWFIDVEGGSNKYDANVSLGMYYKFNEGITGDSSIDSVVLDYSGRVTNGSYVGYSTTTSRNTGSAINDLNLDSVREEGDPIIRVTNPSYTALKAAYELTGSSYDYQNNSRLLNHLPSWIIEEEEKGANELVNITQIMASYFDTIYNQINGFRDARNPSYISGSITSSINEFPYNDRMVEGLGVNAPELFANIDTMGQFLERDEQINFDNRLEDVKNVIYKNMYNNLAYILKSKGNEKSIRNFIRCLGVGDDIIDLNTYTDNADYQLESSYKNTVSSKKYVDATALLNQADDEATVYQYYDSSQVNSVGLITASNSIEELAFSVQTEVVFPDKQNYLFLDYDLPSVVSSSLFGYHTPVDPSQTSTNLTWAAAANDYGLQVYAVKSPGEYAEVFSPLDNVKDAYFVVKNRAGATLLTSSIFNNVYDNKKWNFTLSVRPKKYPFADGVTGADVSTNGYTLELYGINQDSGAKKDSFSITGSLSYNSGSMMIEGAKRIYAGAHRTNYTGSTLTPTDIRFSSVRYWTDYLPAETLDFQAKSVESYGRLLPYKNAYSFQTNAPQVYIPKIQTLAMNWEFSDISAADGSGQFIVKDYSSGSNSADYASEYQGALSSINLRQHTGRGDFFQALSTPIRKAYVQTHKLQPPEYVADDNMVRVLSADENTFGLYVRPKSFYFAVERSMYKSISDRMLEMFASIQDFSNLIGDPVNKYRSNYKRMEKIREIFFRRVKNDIPDLEKYVDYYKWLDTAIGEMVEQLLPGSARYAKDARKIVENHVLERPKIKYPAPIIRGRGPGSDRGGPGGGGVDITGDIPGPPPDVVIPGDPRDPDIPEIRPSGSVPPPIPGPPPPGEPQDPRPPTPIPGPRPVPGGGSLLEGWPRTTPAYGWGLYHHPVDNSESKDATWWKVRADRYEAPISSSSSVLYTRQAVQKAVERKLFPQALYNFSTNFSKTFGGGVNQSPIKKQKFNSFTFDRFEALPSITDVVVPDRRKRIDFRATMDGVSYPGIQIAPFSVFQSSVNSGYNASLVSSGLSNITITNLHQDKIQPSVRHGIPLQGPFADTWVGGKQSRHVNPFRTVDRKEEYSLNISAGTGSFSPIPPGSAIPNGKYLRGSAVKAPVNIRNIQTKNNTPAAGIGARRAGNFVKNYEVVQTVDRSETNMDFAFNTSHYAYSMPSAFITPPLRRAAGLTGSADYPAPRQRANRRTNETIFVDRFSAPGGKQTSKQQFRDVNSDQFSPNNALPFRNLVVRQPYNQLLAAYVKFGGYNSLNNLPSVDKTQRNTRQRIQINTTSPTLTYETASLHDNAFVTHPIPTADRAQWTSYISGSDNLATYNAYVALGDRYPKNISFVTQSAGAYPASFNLSLITNLANVSEFKWSNNRDFVPWKQLRAVDSAAGRYYGKNNIYEILPKISLSSGERLTSPIHNFFTGDNGSALLSRTTYDQKNNSSTYYYSQRVIEPPVTSRYKPMVHHITTPIGTPSRTSQDKTDVSLEYSFGNYLMGFANRELNYEIAGDFKFNYGKIKRPYEIIREKFIDKVNRTITGIDLLKVTSYSETIYPKEVYTYLSGSRSRLAFVNNFWRQDNNITSTDMSSVANYTQLTSSADISTYSRLSNRLQSGFVTSQGYAVQKSEQLSHSNLDPILPSGAGEGSRWPLDSYVYAESTGSLVGILTSPANLPIVFADAGTMASGELMMTHYGIVSDQYTANVSSPPTAFYLTSSINSAQYVYNIATTVVSASSTPATAATASVTASYAEGQGYIPASGSLVFGLTANDANTNLQIVQIEDLSSIFSFQFDNTVSGTTFTSPDSYAIGTLTGSTGQLTTTQVRDALFDAIVDATTGATVPTQLSASATKAGSYTINLTATIAGTSMNAKLIDYSNPGSASGQINVTSWVGGDDYTYNSKFLDLTDVAHGTVSYAFDAGTAPAASTAGIIGTQTATAAQVAGAIAQTIGLSQAAGAINITPGTVVGTVVPLTADVAGTGMNGQPIAGSVVSDGGVTKSDFAGGASATSSSAKLPEVRSPGSVYTRPFWSAARERKYVAGTNKGSYNTISYPFYDSYETYAMDIRRAGKDHTILPEYRISEHVDEQNTVGSLLNVVSSSLEISGASAAIYDGSQPQFWSRYTETDKLEFLEDFMPSDRQDRNHIFNNYPRHLEISSHAFAKLLPYDGFYPVNRTMQIASLFRTAYVDNAVFTGTDSSKVSAWRSILRPFYAPGILYNSIKSGVAVDYPIRRDTRNTTQYLSASSGKPLDGCLTGSLSVSNPAGSIPGNKRRGRNSFDWSSADVNAFYWADKLPFESIMNPAASLATGSSLGTVLSDLNEYLFLDVTGSLNVGNLNDNLYKKSISNFLANVPEFFLKQKENKYGKAGYLTKFVSQFGYPPKDPQQSTSPERIVQIERNAAYMMEVGLFKTDNFNIYSNPYAYGIPTATGSVQWETLTADELPKSQPQAWPKYRGDFAPFTPPYYYGPSLVRVLFMPQGDKTEYTLDEILNNTRGELFVQYLNESGSYYDMTSGSYIDRDGNSVTSTVTPSYGWNRAWQNRMDLDASVSLFNSFPIDNGTYKSFDPNKWTIMPKWECPILDYPNTSSQSYNFSSSVTPSEYVSSTQGMWHQYGVEPNTNQGVYLYIKDVPTGKQEEYDLAAITYDSSGTATREYKYVKKVPKFAVDSGREIQSMADLCGFDPDEIIRSGMDFSKAKRLGELAEDDEKTLSEAVLAIPFYVDDKENLRMIPLRASPKQLGPKIKQFRKQFTKFSLPPALAAQLTGLVPRGYPYISDVINPFGTDDYDSILEGSDPLTIPVVYLMEHKVSLTKQDLSDIWQGVLPDIGSNFKISYSAIDHYLPGDNVEEVPTKFPEVLKKQIELNIPNRDGHPRYDLLDVSEMPDKRGLYPQIRWLVFKVKERGIVNYSQMIMEEVDGKQALEYDNVMGYFSQMGLSNDQITRLMGSRDNYSKTVYGINHSLTSPSYNWPYDYCSLLELGKINTKVVFRPELEKEFDQDTKPPVDVGAIQSATVSAAAATGVSESLEAGITQFGSTFTTIGNDE